MLTNLGFFVMTAVKYYLGKLFALIEKILKFASGEIESEYLNANIPHLEYCFCLSLIHYGCLNSDV